MDRTIWFETDRIILRKFKTGDEVDMFNNYASRDVVTEFLSWKTHKSLSDTESFLNQVVLPSYNEEYAYRWAIVFKETNQVIGSIDVVEMNAQKTRAELGWVLSDDYWGQGIMPECARIILKYLFEQGFSRIQAYHHIDNKKSGRVMQKIGMTFEATLKNYGVTNKNEVVSVDMYAITNANDIK